MKKKYIDFEWLFMIITLTAICVFILISCEEERKVDNSQYYFEPPTGITATLLSDDRTIHITWNGVSNAGHYELSFRTNLDSTDTRRYLGTSTNTRYEYSYYWYWYNEADVTTLYFYIKTHPSKSVYIASSWSNPVSVNIR